MVEHPETTSLRRAVGDDDLEEIRVGVAMSGGVSLAVWIGGVTRELNRLQGLEPDGSSVYAEVLDVTRSRSRVDVVSGTSAGGLNGAFLALASAYGTDLDGLPRLWVDQGAFARLLRPVSESDPPSLMRGDEYFLPALGEALDTVAHGPGAHLRPPAGRPLHLTLTTTVMKGHPRTFTDDHGNPLHEVEHLGLFTFRRDERTDPARSDPGRGDPFAHPRIVEQLALASRSTASFPFAFEASYVPIGSQPDPLHPDMAGLASFTTSSFVLDGGVLVNRPVAVTLRAIHEQAATNQVRRVLMHVDPDPAGVLEREHQQPDEDPTLREVLVGSLLSLPRAQSLAVELDALRRNNARVAERRRLRANLTHLVTGTDLASLARTTFPGYRQARVDRVAEHVIALGAEVGAFQRPDVAAGTRGPRRHPRGTRPPRSRRPDAPDAPETGGAGPQAEEAPPPWWSPEELRAAFAVAAPGLPFVPGDGGLGAGDASTAGAFDAAVPRPDQPWRWGLAPIERIGWVGIDLLRRALWVVPANRAELRAALRTHRGELHELLATLRELRADDTAFWTRALARLPDPPLDAAARVPTLTDWVFATAAVWPVGPGADTDDPSGAAARARDLHGWTVWGLVDRLLTARDDLVAAVAAGRASDIRGLPAEAETLAGLLETVYPGRQVKDSVAGTVLLRRLLTVEIAMLLLAPATDVEQAVELIHVSGHVPSSFGGPDTPGAKLAGVRLGHFAAFYKHAWRANDWLWGRIDGATRIVQMLLGPARLRQLRYSTAEAADAIESVALGPDGHPDRDWLDAWFDRDACERELAYLDDEHLRLPASLPTCATAIARRIHLEILRGDDLATLAAAVGSDARSGVAQPDAGSRFLARLEQAERQHGGRSAIPAEDLVPLFRDSGIGAEQINDDAGSDLFARTVSQSALVGVSALEGARSGLGPARVLLRSVRGFLLVLYALVVGATRSGGFGRTVVALGLAGGGALVAVAVLTEDTHELVMTAGVTLLLAGLGLAAVRSRSWLLAGALLLPMAAAVVTLVAVTDQAAVTEERGTLIVIGALVGGSLALGSLRISRVPPWPVRGSTRRRLAVLVLGVALTAAVWTVLLRYRPDGPSILALEFAWSVERFGEITGRWGAEGVETALTQLRWDFAFLAVYWLPIAAAGSLVADGLERYGRGTRAVRGARMAAAAGWMAVAAAVLDAVENVALMLGLDVARAGSLSELSSWVPAFAGTAATAKFLFIGVAMLVVLGAFGLVVARRRPRGSAHDVDA